MDIHFNKLQQDSLDKFFAKNPKIKNNKILASQLELNSKLMCTINHQFLFLTLPHLSPTIKYLI